MPTELKMPALSPTMEEGTLARWLKQEGDAITPGDILAEIETDKATMEFEAIDEGVLGRILVPQGTESVKVGTVIALLEAEGDDTGAAMPSSLSNGVPAPMLAEPGSEAAGDAEKSVAQVDTIAPQAATPRPAEAAPSTLR